MFDMRLLSPMNETDLHGTVFFHTSYEVCYTETLSEYGQKLKYLLDYTHAISSNGLWQGYDLFLYLKKLKNMSKLWKTVFQSA